MHPTVTEIALFLMTFIVGGIFFESVRNRQSAWGLSWVAILSVLLTRQIDFGVSPLVHDVLFLVEFGLLMGAMSLHLLHRRARRAAR